MHTYAFLESASIETPVPLIPIIAVGVLNVQLLGANTERTPPDFRLKPEISVSFLFGADSSSSLVFLRSRKASILMTKIREPEEPTLIVASPGMVSHF